MHAFSVWKFIGIVAVCALSSSSPTLYASAQYPSRPSQVIVPYAPGGITDLAERIVAKAMGDSLGQPAVVENKHSAAGSVSVAQALRARADGDMMAVFGVSSTMIHDLLGRKLPYDPKVDLNAEAYLGLSDMVVITSNDSPYTTLAEVIAASKKDPGSVSFGSAGNASPGHMATEYLVSMAGIDMTHVPYPGDSALMSDLVSGRIDIATLAEAGNLHGYEAEIWDLLVLPKGSPSEIDQRLNTTINDLMRTGAVKDSLLQIGYTSREMDLSEVQAFIQTERVKWGKVIKDANIQME